MTWLTPFGFNSPAYCIAMRSEMAERTWHRKISDLKEHAPDMILGSDFDFLEEDGLDNFNKIYG